MKKKAAPRKNYSRSIQTFVLLTVVVLVAGGVYGFLQYQKLSAAQKALANGQTQLTQLRAQEKQYSDQYTLVRNAYDEEFAGIRDSIQGVFPSEENYTTLTKTLDKYVLDLNKKSPTIFMNNLRFSSPRIEKDKGYAILPFSMSLNTTRKNLDEFLEYTENSGSIDDKTRLLDVRSISISFSGEQTVGGRSINTLNVAISLNAYFQLPAEV